MDKVDLKVISLHERIQTKHAISRSNDFFEGKESYKKEIESYADRLKDKIWEAIEEEGRDRLTINSVLGILDVVKYELLIMASK